MRLIGQRPPLGCVALVAPGGGLRYRGYVLRRFLARPVDTPAPPHF